MKAVVVAEVPVAFKKVKFCKVVDPVTNTVVNVGSGLNDPETQVPLTAKHPVERFIPLVKVEVPAPVTKSCVVEAEPPSERLPVMEVEVPVPVIDPDPSEKVLAVSAVEKRLVDEAVVLKIVVPVALV